MILEIDQKPTHIDISYISEEGNKELCQVSVPNGYSNWVIDHSQRGTMGYIDISGKPVTKVHARSFNRFDLLQHLKQLPEATTNELFAYREANLVCSDIETDIGDRFPVPELAEQPINAISCVDQNLNMIVYTTFDCERDIEYFENVECDKDTEGAEEDHDITWELGMHLEVNEETGVAIGIRAERGLRNFEDYGYKLIDPSEKESGAEQWWFEDIKEYDREKITEILQKDSKEWPKIVYLRQVRYVINQSMGMRSYREEINAIVKKHIGHLLPRDKFDNLNVNVLQFATEKQMLEAYLSNVVKFASVMTFWNGDRFDIPYITNRCRQLGVPMSLGSITGDVTYHTNLPKHTIFNDYMYMVDEYANMPDRESLRLDYIAYRVLGVGKLPYRGSLKEMQENDVTGFLAYNVIDSIVMQLIHDKLNLMAIMYSFAQVTKLPLSKSLSQVAQTEALISLDTLDWLDSDGMQLPERPDRYDEFGNQLEYVAAFNDIKEPRRGFGGGHVKEVWKHVVNYCGSIDFSGLYPSLHRSYNISVENFLGPLEDIEKHYDFIKHLLLPEHDGKPLQWQIINNKNFFVAQRQPSQKGSGKNIYFTPGGCNVYLNDRAYAYKRIQQFLRAKRDIYRGQARKHYGIQQILIEHALWERGLWKEQPKLPIDPKTNEPYKEFIWEVELNGNIFTPDLCNLNEKHTEDYIDQFGTHFRAGDYKDHIDFIWFLFHKNLRDGMFKSNMEIGSKLVANSLYGATSNQFNGFNNIEVADDTTAEGRNAIICAQMLINNYLNYEWHEDTEAHEFLMNKFPGQFTKLVPGKLPRLSVEDRIVYIDTDSLYVWYEHLLDQTGFTGDPYKFFVEFYSGYLSNVVEERLHYMTNIRHGDSMMKFDLEYVIQLGVWTRMKKYMLATAYENGRYYEDPVQHLKIKGMDLIQGYLSEPCRGLIKDAIEAMLYGKIQSKSDYIAYMMEAWTKFQEFSIDDISKRVNLKKEQYEKYVAVDNGETCEFRPRCNPQYRGAAWYNWWVNHLGLDTELERIDDGGVCFYYDAYGTEFAFRINDCPDFAPEPNRVIQFYKMVVNAINRIADVFGYTTPLELHDPAMPTDDDEEYEE